MPMYGIRDRSPFIQYQNGLTSTLQDSKTHNEGQRRYFSSLDAEIYFGNYYIDEAVNIMYRVQQNTMPLYGYNSYIYDEVALGSRIIQGQFTVNFTRPGYLFDLMKTISKEVVIKDTEQVEKDADGLAEAGILATDDSDTFTSTDYDKLPRGRRPIFMAGFDIDIMFGQEDFNNPAKHVLLEGVYITDSTIGLDTTGQPITETYSFVARDLIPIE